MSRRVFRLWAYCGVAVGLFSAAAQAQIDRGTITRGEVKPTGPVRRIPPHPRVELRCSARVGEELGAGRRLH